MFQRDYILRMMEQFTKVLAKVLFNKQTKNYEAAHDEIRKSYRTIFGIDEVIIYASSAEEIVELLKLRGKNDPKVYIILAELLREEADLFRESGLAKEEYAIVCQKALSLYFEAILDNPMFQTKEYFEKINFILDELKNYHINFQVLFKTMKYFELTGKYSQAENVLFDLVELNPIAARNEGIKFYERLQLLSDEKLEAGNYSREEISQGQRDFNERLNSYL